MHQDMMAAPQVLNVRPHANDVNQSVPNPVSHFLSIPWCHRLLTDPGVAEIIVPDRNPLKTGGQRYVRSILNCPAGVHAWVNFASRLEHSQDVASVKLREGGGAEAGETQDSPFVVFSALVDVREDLTSYAGTLHGAVHAALLDETMSMAANLQASENGAFTGELRTKYLKPVKLPKVILVRSRVVRKVGRKIVVRGSIQDKDGSLVAESEGTWISMTRSIGRSQRSGETRPKI